MSTEHHHWLAVYVHAHINHSIHGAFFFFTKVAHSITAEYQWEEQLELHAFDSWTARVHTTCTQNREESFGMYYYHGCICTQATA
jgi:hypothetical protein